MRRNVLTGLILCAGISALMSTVSAQGMPGMGAGGMGGVAADPFTGYYSWFLPRQAAMAAQSTVGNQLNMYTSDRVASQNMPQSNMGNLDLAGLGLAGASVPSVDSDAPRNPRPRLSSTGPIVENSMGKGLNRYHERAGSYYPTMRRGTFANPGLPPSRRGGR
jgi:hypothetical protein